MLKLKAKGLKWLKGLISHHPATGGFSSING
jgi:hypothetical protein